MSARIARNTQLLLQEETAITKVADPWGGSYMMESLTQELADGAMEIIEEVEAMGGMTRAIESGMAKLRIEEAATKKQARIDAGEETVVGVNKYVLEDDAGVDVLDIDNESSRNKQCENLAKVRFERDNFAVEEALDKLRESAKLGTGGSGNKLEVPHELNLLALSIDAARLRATVGEISDALRDVWGSHVPSNTVVQGAYSATFNAAATEAEVEYNELQVKIQQFEADEGRRPRILVAKMGQDGHDRGAKVIASGFSDIGYDVDIGPLFQTPEEVAQQAIDSDVHVVGISSQAAGHKALVPVLIEELKKRDASHIKVICGGVIPPQDYEFLMGFGVAAIFGPGTRITTAATEVLEAIRK